MLNKLAKSAVCLFLAALVILTLAPACLAAEQDVEELRWTNPETGYEAVLLDELGLLTSKDRAALLEDMKPLTDFGNIAFWTNDCIFYTSTLNGKTDSAHDHMNIARLKRRDLFLFEDATIFMINMFYRKLVIQSYGNNLDVLTKTRADVITNNVRSYATSGKYFSCASAAMDQMRTLFLKGHIPQPMKYMSNLCIGLMLGLLVALRLVLREYERNHAKTDASEIVLAAAGIVAVPALTRKLMGTNRVYHPANSGGSSCSSCSGGSSCSSCGGCGGGGSSSF